MLLAYLDHITGGVVWIGHDADPEEGVDVVFGLQLSDDRAGVPQLTLEGAQSIKPACNMTGETDELHATVTYNTSTNKATSIPPPTHHHQ